MANNVYTRVYLYKCWVGERKNNKKNHTSTRVYGTRKKAGVPYARVVTIIIKTFRRPGWFRIHFRPVRRNIAYRLARGRC